MVKPVTHLMGNISLMMMGKEKLKYFGEKPAPVSLCSLQI
jgi:hypothetical protein